MMVSVRLGLVVANFGTTPNSEYMFASHIASDFIYSQNVRRNFPATLYKGVLNGPKINRAI